MPCNSAPIKNIYHAKWRTDAFLHGGTSFHCIAPGRAVKSLAKKITALKQGSYFFSCGSED